jgi:hypothetical protein
MIQMTPNILLEQPVSAIECLGCHELAVSFTVGIPRAHRFTIVRLVGWLGDKNMIEPRNGPPRT